ncbi:MAG: DUF2842 domain-containing protein [Alphaproteobacteria bacterium]|nr:DUF2842 domain-containing protein [Alphaproteobacteria bacterium]MDE2631165.1 DUF2842 domain-containing protein [Alphaproteobacteria bacterium]
MRPLSPHFKKLIGTLIMLVWLVAYALIAMSVAVRVLPHANWLVELFYYLIAGTLWIVPVGLMLPWMYREPKTRAE